MATKSSKRWRYIIYLVSVIIIILAAFNTYITLRIHRQLAQIVSKPGKWPAGAYIYDEKIGFDFAPNISGQVSDGSYYVKSHQLGYRISENEDAAAFRPGGILSLGCSFTYGDEVESYQTFTQVAADSLGIPAYNYGISSFSYTHALLKARELKGEGVLDRLKPKYVVLGCWNGLPDRSRTPFPPLASKTLPLPAAYMVREDGKTKIEYPLDVGHVFSMVDLYREEGTGLSPRKFFKLFAAAPGYVYLYVKNNQMAQKWRSRTLQNDLTDYQAYDFYFTGIEEIFSEFGSKIIILYLPNKHNEDPARDLLRAVEDHPGLLFANGLEAIEKYGVPHRQYQGRHPQPAAHEAYGRAIVDVVEGNQVNSVIQGLLRFPGFDGQADRGNDNPGQRSWDWGT